MKRIVLIGIGIAVLSAAGIQAEEVVTPAATPTPKVERKKPPRPELKDITVVGTIEKIEKQNKDGKSIVRYSVTGENDSAYSLRVPPRKDLPGATIPELVGCKVKITGKGQEGKHNVIVVISSIEKIDAAPAAAATPATPAGPAAAK